MEKRALIAVVLSIIILIAYQYFFIKPKIETLPPSQPPKETGKKEIPDVTVPLRPKEEKTLLPKGLPTIDEKVIKVETSLYSAVFSSRGGVIKSFTLKEYKNKDGSGVDLLKKTSEVPPLSIGETRDLSLSTFNFSSPSDDIILDGNETAKIVFDFTSNGIKIKRTYIFYGGHYEINLKDEVKGLRNYYITLGSDFGMTGAEGYGTHTGPVLLKGLDREEFKPDKKMDSIRSYTQDIKWIAQEDKYFFSSIVPLSAINEALVWKREGTMLIAIRTDKKVNDFLIFAGPKKEDILKPLNVELESIIDFGFFSIIARPIFWILEFINKFMGNYGWSIILLTIVLRVPFIPLINKGQSSMKKLQKLQPMMNDIREKFKKNPQRMQKEMMGLYKKHKVNPMGGCLPIVIQIPVFFALYKVLLVAIELKGAPFMLWIHDLSEKDPFYILPIIMGASMFLQQKMSPTSMDPRQAKMMMFLPIIFTFMFLNFPSGLVLYWLVSNILSIVQQFYVNKKTG